MVVFLSGAALILGGSMPIAAKRLEFLDDLVPLAVLELSHNVTSAIGVALLILSRGLFRRLRGAYQATIVLMVAAFVLSFVQRSDDRVCGDGRCIAALVLWISARRVLPRREAARSIVHRRLDAQLRHGNRRQRHPGTVRISARRIFECVVVAVRTQRRRAALAESKPHGQRSF